MVKGSKNLDRSSRTSSWVLYLKRPEFMVLSWSVLWSSGDEEEEEAIVTYKNKRKKKRWRAKKM